MGTGCDFTCLEEGFFSARPDFSANAKLAAMKDPLPSGNYVFRIEGSRFTESGHGGRLSFDIAVLEGPFAGRHMPLDFYVYHPLTRIRKRACERLRCLQKVCGLADVPLTDAGLFYGRTFMGTVWNYRYEGLPAAKIVRFYFPDGSFPGMQEGARRGEEPVPCPADLPERARRRAFCASAAQL